MDKINLEVKKCRDDVILPSFSSENAGIDLRVLTEDGQPVTVEPDQFCKFRTGIKMNIPEGYYIEIVPRSSMGIKKTLRVMNTVGILDPSWTGETMVFVHNFGKDPVIVENNERLCQMILHKIVSVDIKETTEIKITERGEAGFGSSGRF